MSGSHDNLQTSDFRPDGVAARLFQGCRDAAYTRVLAAFVLASLSHLWLDDAAQPGWFGANVVYGVGLVLLVGTRGAMGWLGCALGLLIPLLFLRDQLTQSVLLLAVAGAGAWTTLRRPMQPRALVSAARGLLIVTYFAAVFHKLNRDFFDPAVGCATYGMRELAEYYRIPSDSFASFEGGHALLVVVLELGIPLAYLLGRRHIARLVAVLFHIPLTLTMAPAFAFVMLVGHAAFLTDDDAAQFREGWSRHRVALIVGSVAITAASLAAHGAWPEWTMVPREWAMWLALLWCVQVLSGGRAAPDVRSTRWGMPAVVTALFAVCCLTPYLGIQFQHTGAMLSNLRIDDGCWNHFIVPEGVRLTDDYVRVDAVVFGEPGAIPEYERIVLDQLWSPPQFRQMQRNWCRPEVRPLELHGTFRGASWDIEDLCDDQGVWPFAHDGVLGVELFGNFLRFQKNLERACPQACIH